MNTHGVVLSHSSVTPGTPGFGHGSCPNPRTPHSSRTPFFWDLDRSKDTLSVWSDLPVVDGTVQVLLSSSRTRKQPSPLVTHGPRMSLET